MNKIKLIQLTRFKDRGLVFVNIDNIAYFTKEAGYTCIYFADNHYITVVETPVQIQSKIA